MSNVNSYVDLKVWEKSHQLTLDIYRLTGQFPVDEKYGLTSQIRRAAISVGVNIVEGKNRNTTKEFIQFLYVSRGSIQEVHYLLLLSRDLEYLSHDVHDTLSNQCEEVGKMLNGLIKSLK